MKKWFVKILLKQEWFVKLVKQELNVADLEWLVEDYRSINKKLSSTIEDMQDTIDKYVDFKSFLETSFNSDIDTIIGVFKENIAKFLPFFVQPKPKRKYNKKKK